MHRYILLAMNSYLFQTITKVNFSSLFLNAGQADESKNPLEQCM